jgi:hypothetical protein
MSNNFQATDVRGLGQSFPGNRSIPECTNLQPTTAPTLARDPSTLTPWNERPTLCI